jgi:hypothetical protein
MGRLGTMLQIGRTFGARDGMLRLEYELQRGSGWMSRKMRSVQGWDVWDLRRIASQTSAEEMRAARRNGTRPFFFSDVRTLRTSIRTIVGQEGEKSVLAEAEHILAGNLPFFGQLSFACEFPPRWFQNPITGQSVAPRRPWTQMRFASPEYGDLKFILEPSRFLFVYPLIRAYALTGDERFPEAFWRAIEDWARHNPPMVGPLWICGQECSLRILAWSFALHAFVHSSSTTNQRVALLVSMISAHAWRTGRTLGYARSQRSNHLISEAVGLWTAGMLYPELRDAEVWQELGTQLLHEAVLDQITVEGVSHQHSFNYQRMILHLLLWTLRLAEIHNAPLHDCVRYRTQAAFEFMRSWVDSASGISPNYGSNDGSLIFPFATAAYRDFRPLLQLGAAVLNRPSLEPGPWDEAALWFGVKPASMEKSVAVSPPVADIGYFRLGDEDSWALIRAGNYTRRPFQADQLHVDLWWRGINVARDAGTYLYNGTPPWNNGFARTYIHNTVTVDHHDQMGRASRFLWVDWAQASGRISFSPNCEVPDRFEGEHDGYRHLGVIHCRVVHWLRGAGWIIVDDVKGTGDHDVRLHWLTPDLPYEICELPFQIVYTTKPAPIRWSIFSGYPGSAVVMRAGTQVLTANGAASMAAEDVQMFGWESPTYGDLRPAISLLYQTRSRLPVRIVTVVLADERYNVEETDNEVVIGRTFLMENPQDESEIYRVSLSPTPMHTSETQASPAGGSRA